MKTKQLSHTLLASAALLAFASSAGAAVINSADVAGLKTFQDTNTNRVWLDLDNFFNMSTTAMIASANAAGFSFAARSDVNALLLSLPLTGGEWPSYKAIMGDAPNRELIWGSYDGGHPTNIGWAFSFDTDTAWSFVDNTGFSYGEIPNPGGQFADMNIWAYQTGGGNQVPEPASLALLGIGLAGLAAMRRRKA